VNYHERALLVIDRLNDFVREGAQLEVPGTRSIILGSFIN